MQPVKSFKELDFKQKQKALMHAKFENEGMRHKKDHKDYWTYQKNLRDLIFYHNWDGIISEDMKKIIGEE